MLGIVLIGEKSARFSRGPIEENNHSILQVAPSERLKHFGPEHLFLQHLPWRVLFGRRRTRALDVSELKRHRIIQGCGTAPRETKQLG